jgi:hypothetical protein
MWYVSATRLLYWAHHASTLFNSICRVISSQSRGSIRKVSITKKFRPFSDFLLVPCTKKRKLFLASLSMSKWHHPHQQRPFIASAEKSMHLYIVLHMSFLCHICVTLPSFSHISPQAKGLASSCALRLHHLQGLLHLWAARIGLARARRSGDHVTHGRILLKGWVEPNLGVTWWGNLTYPNHVSNALSYI